MNKSLKFIIRDSRAQVLGILFLLWIAAIVKEPSWQVVLYPLYSVLLLSFLDLGLTFFKTKKWYYPFSSMVSGLLIGFLIHYSQGIIILTTAVLLAFVSKQFIKIKKRHIFNPAALGAYFSSLILNHPISWWVIATGGILTVIPILASFTLHKLRRLQFTIIFLLGYFIFFTLIQGVKASFSLTFDGTIFLFAFIMLTEPMTSNINGFWKYGFSIVILGIVIINYFLRLNIGDPLLFSLLLTNLLSRLLPK